MNFTDTIKIQALYYGTQYISIGGKVFAATGENLGEELPAEEAANFLSNGIYDENGNEIEPAIGWLVFGKEKNAIIFPNSKANKMSLVDGKEYVYSFEVIVKLRKNLYPIIPQEGARVWLYKADGTINKEMEVKGFVTLKQRYLKLWL